LRLVVSEERNRNAEAFVHLLQTQHSTAAACDEADAIVAVELPGRR
jgi:hypothetical protein